MGSPGALGKQVQIMRVSRGWEDRGPLVLWGSRYSYEGEPGLGGQGLPQELYGSR